MLNEKAIDRDPEGAGDLVEHVDRQVGGGAFDVRDRLSGDAGGVGERGLRETRSGSLDDEIPGEKLSRGGSGGRGTRSHRGWLLGGWGGFQRSTGHPKYQA